MKHFLAIAAFCLCALHTTAQTLDYNFDLEKTTAGQALPSGWIVWGNGCEVQLDSVVKHGGKNAIRVKQPNEKNRGFGCPAYEIPLDFEGKEISLNAWLKFENVHDGNIGLLLRIDDDDNHSLKFENLQEKNIHGTADWTQYTVTLPIPKGAKKIYIGALLSGIGTLWADDFELTVDGKDFQQIAHHPPPPVGASRDKEFDGGSGIFQIDTTPQSVANLSLLCKVWGFLKYYHPAVASADYNWDYELFRILPKVLEAGSTEACRSVLSDWVAGYGTVRPSGAKSTKIKGVVKRLPELDWINPETLGQALYSQLTSIKQAERFEFSYYIGMTPKVGNPVFKNENPYSGMAFPDAGYRMLALFRYWNIIQYFYPYKGLIGSDWNVVLNAFIPKLAAADNTLEYRMALLGLIGSIHDTHAGLSGSDDTAGAYLGLNKPAILPRFVENQLVVYDYYLESDFRQTGLQIGDVITTINGRPVQAILDERLHFFPASNHPTELRNMAPNMLRTNDSILTITYQRGQETGSVKLPCFPRKSLGVPHRYQGENPGFQLINPEIALLNLNFLKNEQLDSVMPKVMNTQGLIIDFRSYPADYFVYTLSAYLMPKPTEFVRFSKGSITQPGLFMLSPARKTGKKNKQYYKGKIAILVDETTQSSAEYHTMAFRVAPRAVVIGSTTAGADGDVSFIELPGGIKTAISGIGIYYPDGTETQRVGIIPDFELKPTVKGIAEGRDELMGKAVEWILEK